MITDPAVLCEILADVLDIENDDTEYTPEEEAEMLIAIAMLQKETSTIH